MKVKFSKSVSYIPEWNKNRELSEEEQIKTVIAPMEIGELITLMDSLGLQGSENDQVAINMKNYNEAIKELKHIIPKYIKIENFKDDEGADITIEEIITYGQFMALSVELLMQCVQVSVPNEGVEKN